MAGTEEIVCALPVPAHRLPETTQFRSTWLSSSIQVLRTRKLFDTYLKNLPKEHHGVVLDNVVGAWLPVSVACAHYEACDRLLLPVQEIVEIGHATVNLVQHTVLATVVKMSRGAGATPWTLFPQLHRFWERVWTGGGVEVSKLGPKEARVEVVGWSCSKYPYVRHAMRGVFVGLTELYCTRAYANDVSAKSGSKHIAYRISWA